MLDSSCIHPLVPQQDNVNKTGKPERGSWDTSARGKGNRVAAPHISKSRSCAKRISSRSWCQALKKIKHLHPTASLYTYICNCRERPPPQPARCRQQPALIRLPKSLKYLNQVQSWIFPKVCKLKELTRQIEATERDVLDKETYSCYGCDVPSPDLKAPI